MTRSAPTSIVVFGASGDLAKKKTFPALLGLFRQHHLPTQFQIIGYARSKLELSEFRQRVTEKAKLKDEQMLYDFQSKLFYISGDYDNPDSFRHLNEALVRGEKEMLAQLQGANSPTTNIDGSAVQIRRIYYLALPPAMFHPVCTQIRNVLHDPLLIHRVIVEKPFGKDLESSNRLSSQLAALFDESELYRIDHYLGKEMVKNIMVLRFANMFFSGVWSRQFIKNVQITFKEPFGTEGRGGYFDEFGIIRDVLQNHLLQVLAIVAMERPVSLRAEDVRDEKVKVLKCIQPLTVEHLLIGQYSKSLDGSKPAYLDDETVPKGSLTPTYAACTLYINNERWSGVPFILKAGKALNEHKAEVRIQLDDVAGSIFENVSRNELVIRVQPNEAVYMKLMNKKPGLGMDTVISELDLSYKTRYSDLAIPDAYEALLLDVLKGDRSNFVRSDELECAWRIFTPILHELEAKQIRPQAYPYGSRGPGGAADFVSKYGYVRDKMEYVWSPISASTPQKL